ncbi:MAG: EAL domain-containing protein [Maledivibacter sp.]|jgi:diguanylate cyclase (GGDEF)-like protein/PAS domain S-box-containing protein|nr:EAL domain-containing protein [Maledivibacter sp.]
MKSVYNHMDKINDQQYYSIINNIAELICRFLPDTTLTFVNKAYSNYFKKKPEVLIGSKFINLLPKKRHKYIISKLQSINIDNPSITYENQVLDSKGKTAWQKWTIQGLFNENDNIVEFQAICIDITYLKKAEEYLKRSYNKIEQRIRQRTEELEKSNARLEKEINERIIIENELRQSEERYRKLVELLPNGIVVHVKGIIIFSNTAFAKLVGEDNSENLIGRNLLDFIHPKYHKMAKDHVKYVNMGSTVKFIEEQLIRVNGKVIDIEAAGAAISHNSNSEILVIVQDISDRKKAEKKIKYLAYHDALTGLPNRYFLNNYLVQLLNNKDNRNQKIAIMFIDLDRFKIINDTLGHSFGDIVLQLVAKRLTKCVRKGDNVCRQGGDEFIILLEDVNQKKISKIAQRIIDEFTYPFTVNGHEIFTSPSIGISLYPTDGYDVESLIKCADMAMYSAKESGKNSFKFYNTKLSEKISRKMDLENGLRRALDNDEFILYYQPQFDLNTHEILGMEALIRWNHPQFGLIPPNEFIPLAEEIGLIIDIGKWVLKTACRQNKIWHEAGFPSIHIAVNISALQFQHNNFIETIEKVLKDTKIDSKYLELEITESIMQNIEELTVVLNTLKTIGVQLSIDDFGTGYSSLSILQHLPIDTLKIDQSFINGIMIDMNTAAIVNTIIDIGKNLKLNVIAEGIETPEQELYLKENSVFIGQGYLLCKPLPAEEIEKILIKSYKKQKNI